MKIADLPSLVRAIEQQKAPAYGIIGAEQYDVRQALTIVLSHCPSPRTFHGNEVTRQALQYELDTIPLFEERRCVVIHDVDKVPASVSSYLRNYLRSPLPSTTLVITAQTLVTTKALAKLIENAGVLLHFPNPKPWEVKDSIVSWIQQQCAVQKKRIAPHASQYLVDDIGMDKMLLSQEIEKLVCYIGDRDTITADDIAAICCPTSTDTIWQWRDVIFARNTSAALRMGHSLLDSGAHTFLSITAVLRSQFTMCCSIADAEERRLPLTNITKTYPYLKGKLLNRTVSISKRYGSDNFKRGLVAIGNVEQQAKNSEGSHELLLEKLIIQLTSAHH